MKDGVTQASAADDEVRIAHLGMIQGVISRVASDAQNSRTLAITLAAAMIAVAQTGSAATPWLAALGVIPTVLFWWQNAYALHVERSYRNLYDEVRTGRDQEQLTMDWRLTEHSSGTARTSAELVVALPYLVVIVSLIVIAVVTREPTGLGSCPP